MRLFSRRSFRPIQHFLYAAFVILWFKDNFAGLRGLSISFWVPFLPLLGLTGLRLFIALREKDGQPRKLRIRLCGEITALVILLLAAVIFRLPYLTHPAGMMTSDDAIPALMGKHIADGKVPPNSF